MTLIPPGRRLTGFPGRGRERARLTGDPGALVAGQLEDVIRDLPVAKVRDRAVLEHAAQRGADRDPDVAEALRVAWGLGLLRGLILDVGEGPLDGPDHARKRDLLRRLGEPVAAARAPAGPHQPGVLELEQDVLEELEGNALRLGHRLALDRLVPRGRHLDGGADGVVGFRRDPHMLTGRCSNCRAIRRCPTASCRPWRWSRP